MKSTVLIKLLLAGCLVSLIFTSRPSRANGPVILNDDQGQYPLGLTLDYLADPTGQLTIDQVVSQAVAAQFTPSQEEIPNFGQVTGAYWIRFTLTNRATSAITWLLELGEPSLRFIDFYQHDPRDQGFVVRQTGYIRPFSTRDIPHRSFVFKLSLPSGTTQTFYLRVESPTITLPLTVWSVEAFATKNQGEQLWLGLVYGSLLIMLAYNITHLLVLRDPSYLYYVLFLASLTLYNAAMQGLASQYLWREHVSLVYMVVPLGVGLSQVTLLQFTRVFLSTPIHLPRLDRVLAGLIIVWLGLMGLVYWLGPRIWGLVFPMLIIGQPVMLLVGLLAWRRNYRPALYYLLACPAPLILAFLTVLIRMGLLSTTTAYPDVLTQAGVIIMTLLLSLALSERFNQSQRETEAVQATMLEQQQEALQLKDKLNVALQQAHDELEVRVKERTTELRSAIDQLEREITERRQVEKILRQSEKQYRLVADNVTDVIWTIDMEGHFTYVSPSVQRLRGYTPEEVMQQPINVALTPESLAIVEEGKRQLFAREAAGIRADIPDRYELEQPCKDGSTIWTEVITDIIRDPQGRLVGILGVTRDISERRQTEKKLRQLSRAVEQTASAVVITDLTGAIEFVNPAFTRTTGYTFEETIGQNPRILQSGQVPDHVYRELWTTITRGEVWEGELLNKKKNGELYWELARISPIKDKDGRITHYIAIKEDINRRKQTEAELKQQAYDMGRLASENARLLTEERRLRHLAELTLAELKATQAQLIHQEKMASLGMLTAGIAHELKNPLNFVNNFAAVSIELVNDLQNLINQQPLSFTTRQEVATLVGDLVFNASQIKEEGNRADRIIRSMLLHSRSQAGQPQKVDLNNLVTEAVHLTYHSQRAKNNRFELMIKTHYDPTLEPFTVIPQDLSRALVNIIDNACYATQVKRGQFNAEEYNPTLVISTTNYPDRVEIRLWDNGPGIAPAFRAKIFNPFFTSKPAGEGTGLGLSISYDIIVHQHRGKLEVHSVEGDFTEFIISLPKKPDVNGR